MYEAQSPTIPRPIALTGDPTLAEELHRLAAAAGVELAVLDEPAEARSLWTLAPLVLVGADLLTDLADAVMPRRDGVHVVARQPVPDAGFRAALVVGAESVVELPTAQQWMVEAFADCADGSLRRAPVVGVVGGCGGVGASTFASALALAAADVVPAVTLVDADPLGSGLEALVGVDEGGAAWSSLMESTGRLGSRALRAALPGRGGVAVLGWGAGGRPELDPTVAAEALGAARRGSDLVVVDLPRYLDEPASQLLVRCDHLVIVTGLTLAAVTATARVMAATAPAVAHAHLLARGSVSGLDPAEVAVTLGLPLAAVMGDQRGLREAVELGQGPLRSRRGPLARAARTVLALLSVAPASRRAVA